MPMNAINDSVAVESRTAYSLSADEQSSCAARALTGVGAAVGRSLFFLRVLGACSLIVDYLGTARRDKGTHGSAKELANPLYEEAAHSEKSTSGNYTIQSDDCWRLQQPSSRALLILSCSCS